MRKSGDRNWFLKTTLKSLAAIPLAYVIGLLCVAGLVMLVFAVNKPFDEKSCETNSSLATRTIYGNDRQVTAEVAEFEADKARGLSGRDCLNEDMGMLFPYALTGDYCFWMKDMKFPIDMIWLDNEKKIVTIMDKASPDTYPQGFCPDRPAQYILEVNAGAAERNGWTVGTGLEFSL